MKSWSFISKRRKLSLSHYLRNVESLEAALEYFKSTGIEPPSNEMITAAIDDNRSKKKKSIVKKANTSTILTPKPKRRTKNQNKRRKPLKKEKNHDGEFDEIVIINTEEASVKD